MKISTKGRYALRMFLDLAQQPGSDYISLKDIAHRQGLSKKYLEQIVTIFNNSDFLKTNRGVQGGYKLSKSPNEYTVGDILKITEGSLAPVRCLEESDICNRSTDCLTRPIWHGLHVVVNNYLNNITLQDILDCNYSPTT